jgi:dUTP pyrophosphatase
MDPARAAGPVEVVVRRLDPGQPLPAYAHPGDAGADLFAAEDAVLPPGGRAVVRTGLAIAVPDGYAAFVHPRSGLAARHGITIVNAPGTIDAGYRGEVGVILLNTDLTEPFTVRRGDRIAQLVVQPVVRARFVPADELPPLDPDRWGNGTRGAGGFGSTGGFGAA